MGASSTKRVYQIHEDGGNVGTGLIEELSGEQLVYLKDLKTGNEIASGAAGPRNDGNDGHPRESEDQIPAFAGMTKEIQTLKAEVAALKAEMAALKQAVHPSASSG